MDKSVKLSNFKIRFYIYSPLMYVKSSLIFTNYAVVVFDIFMLIKSNCLIHGKCFIAVPSALAAALKSGLRKITEYPENKAYGLFSVQ